MFDHIPCLSGYLVDNQHLSLNFYVWKQSENQEWFLKSHSEPYVYYRRSEETERYFGMLESWIAAGRGRDIRLFQLFVGGLMTYFHPIFALLAVLIIAVQTNVIVLRRIFLSWNWSRKGDFLIKGKIEAVIFDFDGTVANTMPFLTDLAVRLMTEN